MSEQIPLREARTGAPRYAWLALAGGSVALIVLGVVLGEPAKILEKATAICLQCIGIG